MKTLFIFVLLCFTVIAKNNNLKVTVYYESLCKDCKNFVKNQLFPAYTELSQYFNLILVPYGKANQTKTCDNKWIFQCQHGPDECLGNKIQACALHYYNIDLSRKLAFIHCLESSPNPTQYGEACSNSVGLNWAVIKCCVYSEMGDNYLAEYGDMTHALKPPFAFVPDIRFNDVYNRTLVKECCADFKSVLCKFIGPVVECQ